MPFAKGLVLSILSLDAEPGEFGLHMIDIGCTGVDRDWMKEKGVEATRFDRQKFYKRPLNPDIKPYQDGELCRPFLPELAPGYDIYIWLDSDIWVQNIETLRLYRDIVADSKDSVPVVPLVDSSYQYFYEDAGRFVRFAKNWSREAYGRPAASTFSSKATFSSGAFAMHATNPFWLRWARELDTVFRRTYSSHTVLHLAEQVAFNYLLYETRSYVALDATYNYNCHLGTAKRVDGNGPVVIATPPWRQIGIVHLTLSSQFAGRYIDGGLLYDCGRYLSADEIARIRVLSHYGSEEPRRTLRSLLPKAFRRRDTV